MMIDWTIFTFTVAVLIALMALLAALVYVVLR